MSSPVPEDAPPLSKGQVEEQIQKYQSFVNDRLRLDLKAILDAREKIYESISEHLKLKNQIELIKSQNLTEMKTMMDVGAQFFMQAKIPDTSKIFINIGMGYSVEFTLDEGLAFIDSKEKILLKQAEKQTDKASQIKAHIKVVLETMQQLMDIETDNNLKS
ncbi:hypothetical protein HK097_011170 [Rhizophlyctis rosea]|uniref:Uncharacterized protein n=1 Tax=Rhizophlyctis rosea TaxID=64517 RepID=A0AAD5X6H0_9FUNG|nr:hypothetical protein HK097_011170 [Rhizophlyctis rosea]